MNRTHVLTVALAFTAFPGTPVLGQGTVRVSVDSGGLQSNGSSENASIDATGRFVAFSSAAVNLVPSDTNAAYDSFVHDLQTGATERVSVSSTGAQSNNRSSYPELSANGRFVEFWSLASNLVPGDTNVAYDVFVRDRQLGTTERVSVGPGGVQANAECYGSAITADGRFVVFYSPATNLVAGDSNGKWDGFVRDRVNSTTERISLSSGGAQGNMDSFASAISADGRFVVFDSLSSNLVGGDTNGAYDVFLRDRQTGTTERMSVLTGGAQANGRSQYSSISADGRFVAFESSATNLVPGDTNARVDIFLHDRQLGTTTRMSVNSGGVQAEGDSNVPTVSADGRYVAFLSSATNLVVGDTNGSIDCFLHDIQTGSTVRVSIDSTEAQGNGDSVYPVLSSDGRYVAFHSDATNLVAGDTNTLSDIFVRDRDATVFTSMCEPGIDGVRPCPCGNAPGGAGRGCNNFGPNPAGGTGGAILTATGNAVASTANTVVFHVTSMQTPCTIVIFFSGTTTLSPGVQSGAGVRCISGFQSPRPYKSIVGFNSGSIDFPSVNSNPNVNAWTRSNSPAAGITKYYYAAYRNPQAGSHPPCVPASAFNLTNAGSVIWHP